MLKLIIFYFLYIFYSSLNSLTRSWLETFWQFRTLEHFYQTYLTTTLGKLVQAYSRAPPVVAYEAKLAIVFNYFFSSYIFLLLCLLLFFLDIPSSYGGNKFSATVSPKRVKGRRRRTKKGEKKKNSWKQLPASLRTPPRVEHAFCLDQKIQALCAIAHRDTPSFGLTLWWWLTEIKAHLTGWGV